MVLVNVSTVNAPGRMGAYWTFSWLSNDGMIHEPDHFVRVDPSKNRVELHYA